MLQINILRCKISALYAHACAQRYANNHRLLLVRHSHPGEPDIFGDHFDEHYVQVFTDPAIDHWHVRKAMNDLLGMDMVPEPTVVAAGLRACRTVNDYALSIRWLEGVRNKCGDKRATIFPWLMQEVQPTMNELGLVSLEDLGYTCPELACESADGF